MKKIILTLTLTLTLILGLFTPSFAYDPYLEGGIPVPEFRGSTVDLDGRVEILGYSKGGELLQNSLFADTQNHWANRAITRMSSQSVVKGYGSNRFYPDRAITRQEVLTLLVRMAGREGLVQQSVGNQGEYYSGNSLEEGYRNQARILGILREGDFIDYSASATREEVAVWIARLLRLQPAYENIEILYTFRDWRDISPSNYGIIEAILQERIMVGDSSGRFNPKGSITRAQVSSILNNISDRFYGERNITPYYGQVINIQRNTVNELGITIDEANITVRNVDGTVTTLKARVRNTAPVNDFVVLKNNIVSNHNLLSVGDEIEYLVRNGEVFYAEAYNDGSILERIKQGYLNEGNLTTYIGRISAITSSTYWGEGGSKKVDRFRVTNIDGQVYDIVVETDLNSGVKNDIIVYDGDKVGGSSLLKYNQDIEYVVRNNRTIAYVKAITLTRTVEKGTIQAVNIPNNQITLLDYNNNIKIFSLAPGAGVTINLRPASLSDLKYGQDVILYVSNGIVTSIVGETYMADPGYIPPSGKVRSGVITYIGSNTVTVRDNSGQSGTYTVTDDTIILKEGRSIRFRDLRDGDKVKLYFDNIYTYEVARMEIEGDEQLVKNIYKGKIDKVDISNKKITITDAEILKNAKWVDADYKITIEFDDNGEIYYRGKAITLNTLNSSHKNDDIYIAVVDSYGKELGVKAVVSGGSERLYADSIGDVNFSGAVLELDNGRNIGFGEDTIIIKDNRLVSPSNLEEDMSAVVVSEYRSGSYRGNIIVLGSMGYRIFDNIYVGKIDSIDRNKFHLIWYSELEDNEWDTVTSSKSKKLSFEYDDDTFIVDLTKGYDEVSAYDFFHDGYSLEDDEDYFTFVVADDDRYAIAMSLRKDELFRKSGISSYTSMRKVLDELILTRGSVESIDTRRNRVELYDSYNWSPFYKEWRSNRNNVYVDVEEALILRGHRVIEIRDIDEDDLVYILRYDEDGIVIFVE